MPAEWLSMTEVQAARGPERSLLYGQPGQQSELIALVYIHSNSECILGWPVGQTSRHVATKQPTSITGLAPADMAALIDYWLSSVLALYGLSQSALQTEFYVAGDPYTAPIAPPLRSDKIVKAVNSAKIVSADTLQLLVLRTDPLVLELLFDKNEAAVQCACRLTEAKLKGLVPFFRKYHVNNDVRAESEISLRAFAPSASFPAGMDVLAPVPVVM